MSELLYWKQEQNIPSLCKEELYPVQLKSSLPGEGASSCTCFVSKNFS